MMSKAKCTSSSGDRVLGSAQGASTIIITSRTVHLVSLFSVSVFTVEVKIEEVECSSNITSWNMQQMLSVLKN